MLWGLSKLTTDYSGRELSAFCQQNAALTLPRTEVQREGTIHKPENRLSGRPHFCSCSPVPATAVNTTVKLQCVLSKTWPSQMHDNSNIQIFVTCIFPCLHFIRTRRLVVQNRDFQLFSKKSLQDPETFLSVTNVGEMAASELVVGVLKNVIQKKIST